MKSTSIILILLLVYSCIGCYTTKVIRQNDEILNCLKQKEGIYYLTTRNSERYSFNDQKYSYKFENDTLYGSAKKVTSDSWQKFEQIKFHIKDIYGIETQEIEPIKSGFFIVALGASVTYFIYYAVSHAKYF